MTTQFISQKKYTALTEELDHLQKVDMLETAKQINEAKELGDLKENAEYHMAREKLSWQKGRAAEIDNILSNAKILDENNIRKDVVGIGVTILVQRGEKEKEYTIVGAQEADPLEGKISNESPLGQAFLGKVVGDSVEVEVPAGLQTYNILEIK
ncbi:MAG: transcription elongation factor GreA [Candidatus Magasanikbacteria bacterium]|jgi:transcription elongation factor GreA|nr:transcription elongation factor GreA [Candidatus Magasanikbacteria bacterium]MBT5262892.1 transcription elongation factor GreA [Candidatus Magasanikbacteria bacterium]MBT5820027.1 transcription elongation factor GreA [Candidatus Magasanikbacteria bacterium]MBT6294691.1 transcription elongation factor GreA [Candidatus Magasanikbacteria bacterium]